MGNPVLAESEGCGGTTVEDDNEVWRIFARNPKGWGQFDQIGPDFLSGSLEATEPHVIPARRDHTRSTGWIREVGNPVFPVEVCRSQ